MRRTIRQISAVVIVTVLRAAAAELQLWVRYTLRACVVVLAVCAAWSWWLHPAITAEVTRQRQAVVSEVRDAATPDLDSARDRIQGWIEEKRNQK